MILVLCSLAHNTFMNRTTEFFLDFNLDCEKFGLKFALWVEKISNTFRVVKVPTIINLTLEHLTSQAERQRIKYIQMRTCM
jgi:hypothetical protein